jgi:hypothetical protein
MHDKWCLWEEACMLREISWHPCKELVPCQRAGCNLLQELTQLTDAAGCDGLTRSKRDINTVGTAKVMSVVVPNINHHK